MVQEKSEEVRRGRREEVTPGGTSLGVINPSNAYASMALMSSQPFKIGIK